MRDKFRVGDRIRYYSDTPFRSERTIIKIENNIYTVGYDNSNMVNEFPISLMSVFVLDYRKVKTTKLARKVYNGRIHKEEDGHLWITM